MELVAVWTGCITGALVDSASVELLGDAGFTDPSVEVTRRYTREELEDLANDLDNKELPAGSDVAAAVDALDGAFASASIRALRPR